MDEKLSDILDGVERANEMHARRAHQVFDNFLDHTERVIANMAALELIRMAPSQLNDGEAPAPENPTPTEPTTEPLRVAIA